MTYRYFTDKGVAMIEISVDVHNVIVRPVMPGDERVYPPSVVEEKPKGKK